MTAAAVPFVSVMLPIRNERMYIEACLERLLRQDYPADRMEILVVDGRSDDGTQDVVRALADRHPERSIRLLDNPARVVPPALNIAIREARGEILVRMDGHTVPAEDYVSACVRALDEFDADNVGGRLSPSGTTAFGRAVAVAQSTALGAGGAAFHHATEPQETDTVYLGAFRTRAFERAGLFDESMIRNQDYEMNVRIRKAGGRVFLDPRIRSTYTPRGTPSALWRQYFQYGWWRVETIRRHPDSWRPRQLIPPAFVGSVLGLALLSFLPPARALLFLLLGAYAVACFGVAVRERARLGGVREFLSFPAAIAIMHVSWAFGFLASAVSGGRYPYRAARPRVPTLRSIAAE